MRYAFVAAIMFACGIACGEDAANMPSVINHGQPAVAAPAVAVETPTADCACADSRRACTTAACCRRFGRVRVRTVTEGCDTCTGQPVRSVTRTVVRGAGAVVERVGDAAVNVITLPGRICRGGRCSCN